MSKLNPEAIPSLLMGTDENEEEEDEPIIVRPDKPTANRILLVGTDDAEEEYDEPLAERQVSEILLAKDEEAVASTSEQAVDMTASGHAIVSTEFTEAQVAIAEDKWDISSWVIYLEEVENQRGGLVTVPESFDKFLQCFPRAAKFWKRLADYYRSLNDSANVEATLKKGAKICWSVNLWLTYLSFILDSYRSSVDRRAPMDEQYNERTKCEAAFESAIEHIGLSVDSYQVWRAYVDFIRSWPEQSPLEATKKINSLRKVYQRAVCTSFEQNDAFWNEYDNFENSVNDPSMENVRQDLSRLHKHSKSILNERKRHVTNIVFDRLATPPTNTASELQQLDSWSSWINFELGNPDSSNPDFFKPMVRMVFQQCLSCFYYNAEIWLALARFEQQYLSEKEDLTAVKNILKQGIEANPSVTLLRISLAELEELDGNIEAAKEVLRGMFEVVVDGFTFALYQRFIRRKLGMVAARKLFSETLALRNNNPKLAIELYMSHALTELELNCLPDIALNVLNTAKKHFPEATQNTHFIRLIIRILVQIGDIKQVRWILQSALEESRTQILATEDDKPSDSADAPSKSRSSKARMQASAQNEAMLKRQLELLEVYLSAETTLGCGDLHHLNKLRDQRHKVKTDYERLKIAMVVSNRDEQKQANMSQRGVFDTAYELIERYESCSFQALPELDQEIRERCRGRNGFERTETTSSHHHGKDLHNLNNKMRDNRNMSTDFHLSMAGLPLILKDLIAKLPPSLINIQPDVDGFVRHMKSVILPPRPAVDEVGEGHDGEGENKSSRMEEDNDWSRPANPDDDDEMDEQGAEEYNDVFRQRQRQMNEV